MAESMAEKCVYDLNVTIVVFRLRLEQMQKVRTWLSESVNKLRNVTKNVDW